MPSKSPWGEALVSVSVPTWKCKFSGLDGRDALRSGDFYHLNDNPHELTQTHHTQWFWIDVEIFDVTLAVLQLSFPNILTRAVLASLGERARPQYSGEVIHHREFVIAKDSPLEGQLLSLFDALYNGDTSQTPTSSMCLQLTGRVERASPFRWRCSIYVRTGYAV